MGGDGGAGEDAARDRGRLNADDQQRILNMPEVQAKLPRAGSEPHGDEPDEIDAFVKSETAKWGKAVKASGAKVD